MANDRGGGSIPSKVIPASQAATNNTGVLQFPKDLGNYAMIFMFEEYNYAKTGKVVGRQERNSAGSLVLPLPSNGLGEKSNIALQDVSLGLFGAGVATGVNAFTNNEGAASAIKKMTGMDISQPTSSYSSQSGGFITQDTFTQLLSDPEAAAKLGLTLAKHAFRGTVGALPGVGEGIDVGTGTAFNNFTTLQFTGVNLRSHEFSWRFFPEDESESKILADIRKKLVTAAHPSYSDKNNNSVLGRALLKYPQLVKIYILINESETYYYQFKPCLIENVSFVYRADNGVILLEGGKPAIVDMSLTVKETGIWIADEFGGSN